MHSLNLKNEKFTFAYLDADKVLITVKQLGHRIDERFPGSGLSKIGKELVSISVILDHNSKTLKKPMIWLRLLGIICMIGLTVLLVALINFIMKHSSTSGSMFDILQGIDSAFNEIILFCISIYFFFRIEKLWKQKLVLKNLHLLRSITHVIDMHQLTKDPTTFLSEIKLTDSSPERELNKYELMRYLDYCSESLSICAKLAALFAQDNQDNEVLERVADIEQLTQTLSQKIWQKIIILNLHH